MGKSHDKIVRLFPTTLEIIDLWGNLCQTMHFRSSNRKETVFPLQNTAKTTLFGASNRHSLVRRHSVFYRDSHITTISPTTPSTIQMTGEWRRTVISVWPLAVSCVDRIRKSPLTLESS